MNAILLLRRLLTLVLLAALAGCGRGNGSLPRAGAAPPAVDAEQGAREAGSQARHRVILLHDNDTHFHDNYTEQVATFIEWMKGWGYPVFLLNAGDIVIRDPSRWAGGPDPEWYLRRGLAMIDRMNRLGYDVAVVGNHELDVHGTHTRQILERARFPFLGANIRVETDLLPSLAPYHHLETPDGIRIAVLGLSNINFDPVEGLEQLGFLETARRFAHLKEDAEALVLLSHIGIRDDLDLAIDFPQADVIIGGHTNTLLPEAILVNGVLVAQAGGQTHFFDPRRRMFMGVVVLEFEGRELVERCGWVVLVGIEGVEAAGRYTRRGDFWRERPTCRR